MVRVSRVNRHYNQHYANDKLIVSQLSYVYIRLGPSSTIAPQPTAVQIVPSGGVQIQSGPREGRVISGMHIGRTHLLKRIGSSVRISERSFAIVVRLYLSCMTT